MVELTVSCCVSCPLQEKEQARQEVVDVQVALQDLEAKEQQESAEKHKLQQSVTLLLLLLFF